MRRGAAGVLATALALAVAACGSSGGGNTSTSASTNAAPAGKPGAGKPAVTLGAKNFTEQFVLGQLYKQALEAKGFKVNLKNNIGSTEIIDKGLTSGNIDFYPEYIGVGLTAVAHDDKSYPSAQAAYNALKKFNEGRGFTLLDETPFTDVDAIAVKPAYAQQHKLKSVADLKNAGPFKIGAPPEFRTRFTGLVGMKKVYGINNATLVPLTIGVQYKALNDGKVQAADVFTTDGQLQSGKYTVLTDPKNIFGFEQVAPIVNKKTLTKEGPAFAQTINAVSAKLTTKAMQQMNGAVDLDKQSPASVAKQFLQANGLA
ncbi:MAG TPA: glycine betaine ABC transporter substrate-binding protein [Thermoleophilaceae bacterium]